MTREKIIQGLYRGDSRAIKEAIKTLEKEPCEDAISKKGWHPIESLFFVDDVIAWTKDMESEE